MLGWISTLATFIGFLMFPILIGKVFQGLLQGFLGGANLRKFAGKWAVVTGCTDGIGKEYALQLAGKGLNVVLVARRKDALDELASEIEKTYSVKTKVIVQDFAKADAAAYSSIASTLNELELGVLVNNVGLSYEYPEYFHECSIQAHRSIISINITSMVEMCHAVLPNMVKNKSGVIINISSISGLFPCPLLATYASSKAFVADFSHALNVEYKKKGITVEACVPAFVVSKMSKIRKPTITVPTPKKFVQSALSSVGYACVSLPYLPHRVQAAFMSVMGFFAPNMRDGQVMGMHLGIKKRAIAKKEREAKKN